MRYEGEGSNSNGVSRAILNGSGASPLHKAALSNSTNGLRSPVLNGSSTNGFSYPPSKTKPSYFGHDREEVSRVLIQALTDLGYHTAAASLSQESGYDLESPSVAAFRDAVLQGEWVEAEALLFGASAEDGSISTGRRGGLTLLDGVDQNLMKFWLREQKFLELLETRDTGRALMVLRSELTPLYQDTTKLHALSSLLMCQSPEHVKAKAEWDGAHGDSRNGLLSALSKCITPSVMLPEHRLSELLHQVKRQQIANCHYHITEKSPSLYQDHLCDRANFPHRPVHEFERHSGECWNVVFSNNGLRLATCGSDGVVFIWDMETLEMVHMLAEHEEGVCSVAWSPDDAMLVTCSYDKRARLWDAVTGEKKSSLPTFGEPVSSCVWAPDGQTFVTGCLDRERNLCQWDTTGELIFDWGHYHRVQDLALSPDASRLVAMSCENIVYVYNFHSRALEYELDFKTPLSSVDISRDSRHLLIKNMNGAIKMLDIDTRETVKEYGQVGKILTVVIRCSFGGANESFVTTGSESGSLYIYHKQSGLLVERLEAHRKGCCNAISWNPTSPGMFASVGDDGRVKIWAAKELPRKPPKRPSNGSDQGLKGWHPQANQAA